MTNYYFYLGYNDGSGKPHGYVIKCYTNEQYLYNMKHGGKKYKCITFPSITDEYSLTPIQTLGGYLNANCN
jgi:hypothetical protein